MLNTLAMSVASNATSGLKIQDVLSGSVSEHLSSAIRLDQYSSLAVVGRGTKSTIAFCRRENALGRVRRVDV